MQDNLKTHVEGILTAHPQPPPCPSEQQKQNGWVSPLTLKLLISLVIIKQLD